MNDFFAVRSEWEKLQEAFDKPIHDPSWNITFREIVEESQWGHHNPFALFVSSQTFKSEIFAQHVMLADSNDNCRHTTDKYIKNPQIYTSHLTDSHSVREFNFRALNFIRKIIFWNGV